MKRSRSPEETTGPSPSVITSESPETWSSGSSEADLLEQPAAKIVELDPAILAQSRAGAGSRSSREDNLSIMKCSMPPHKEGLTFSSYAEYENHYLKAHTNRCVECGKNFPSEHLLNVHIEEFHDSFVAVKRERGEHTYSCFVEGCERKCATHQKRRMHLIDKHMYPRNYFFAVTKEGIDGRRSLLQEPGHYRRRSSTSHAAGGSSPAANRRRQSLLDRDSVQTEAGRPPGPAGTSASDREKTTAEQGASEERGAGHVQDTEMDDLARAMSALQFVPSSVRFGRGGGRAGFSKR